MKLDSKIEALLFFKGEGVKIKELAKLLKADLPAQAGKESPERGVQLIRKEDEVMLGTAPEMSDLIEKIRKEELTKDLGKAGAETLSIVLYKGPVTRSEIDYIRGVNSTFIIRNLLIRGLIEKTSNLNDQRSFLYKPTLELFSFLGIKNIEELPEFDTVQDELKTFIQEEN
jgi:segregation and condensation protein B